MHTALKWLVPLIFILALIAALAGLWPGEGAPYPITNSRGEQVTINARGLYTRDTVSSAAQIQAHDLVMGRAGRQCPPGGRVGENCHPVALRGGRQGVRRLDAVMDKWEHPSRCCSTAAG